MCLQDTLISSLKTDFLTIDSEMEKVKKTWTLENSYFLDVIHVWNYRQKDEMGS